MFSSANYLGLKASYQLSRVDNPSYPTSGVHFSIVPSYNLNVSDTDEKFTRFEGSLTLYNFLWIPKPFVLATNISGGVNWGDFNFYQGHFLGLNNGLRAFRNNRFGGKSSFVISNDLRLKIGTTKGALPLTFGIMGAYDYGRVWSENETSDRWHQSYGGGFFISPFDVMPISFYFMRSTENTSIFQVKLGFAL